LQQIPTYETEKIQTRKKKKKLKNHKHFSKTIKQNKISKTKAKKINVIFDQTRKKQSKTQKVKT